MELQVDVWLRGTDFAKTQIISGIGTDPAAWTDNDVSKLLKAMLLAIHRAKNPTSSDTPVFLRGFSWIVSPEEHGVLVHVEMQMGTASAGPFDIDEARLTEMISRVMGGPKPSRLVH